MKLILKNPTRLEISEITNLELINLKLQLKYTNKKINFDIQRLKNNSHWIIPSKGQDYFDSELKRLKDLKEGSLLFKDKDTYWTYSGLYQQLSQQFQIPIINEVVYPDYDSLPYADSYDVILRDYQNRAVKNLLNAKHGSIEYATGLGKSNIEVALVKKIGLRTLVMVPSLSIASQMYNIFCKAFGSKYVGQFNGKKKQLNKLITIGVAASLTNIEKGSDAWEYFKDIKVFLADESHLLCADTLKKICLGIVKESPYRFSFSGTQLRNDGLIELLNSLIGPKVDEMSVKDGVNAGWLARPIFKVVPIESRNPYDSDSIDKMTRIHLYNNIDVHRMAAQIANRSVKLLKRQTLILIDEISQFNNLLPYFEYEVAFAHGTLTENHRKYVSDKYWNSNPQELVDKFNEGLIPILVGSSCIGLGTDLKPVGCLIYLVGGTSEILIRQSIGRGLRKCDRPSNSMYWPWESKKEDVLIFDFMVYRNGRDKQEDNSFPPYRHALERSKIFNEIYGGVERIYLK